MLWCYYVEFLTGMSTSRRDRLNQLGRDGWELVAVEGDFAYFKMRVN